MSNTIDLSLPNYDEWLELVFDHAVPQTGDPGEAVGQWWFNAEEVEVVTSDPTRFIAHVTRLCREFKDVADSYTLRQLDQGLWLLLSYSGDLGEVLADTGVPLEQRIACVRAMRHPYADFVAPSQVEEMENCFDMWWDLLCDNFWDAQRYRLKGDEILAAQGGLDGETWNPLGGANIKISYADLEPDERRLMDVMLETLLGILMLEDERCQGYALHGLGHLQHPARPEVVQRFINMHRHEMDEDVLKWVESCRDGTVM